MVEKIRRIRGHVAVAYSYINTLLQIVGWGGLALALAVGFLSGSLVAAIFFLSGR